MFKKLTLAVVTAATMSTSAIAAPANDVINAFNDSMSRITGWYSDAVTKNTAISVLGDQCHDWGQEYACWSTVAIMRHAPYTTAIANYMSQTTADEFALAKDYLENDGRYTFSGSGLLLDAQQAGESIAIARRHAWDSYLRVIRELDSSDEGWNYARVTGYTRNGQEMAYVDFDAATQMIAYIDAAFASGLIQNSQ